MPMYSLVVSIYGWSAKNMDTGKKLSGEFKDLPFGVSRELNKLLVPSTNSLCVASTIPVSTHSEFNTWFCKQVSNV